MRIAHVVLCLLTAGAACAAAPKPPARPAPPEVGEANVKAAIERAVEYLFSKANEQGFWDPVAAPKLDPKDSSKIGHDGINYGGMTALVLNALVSAGREGDPRFKKALEWLMQQELIGTYALGLRLELIHRLGGSRDCHRQLLADTRALIKSARPGEPGVMWQYRAPPAKHSYGCHGDYSNVNYAVLGLRAAADEGAEPPAALWKSLEQTWVEGQQDNGGWKYFPRQIKTSGEWDQVTTSMTTAAIASLYLIIDQYHAKRGDLGAFRRSDAYRSIGKGVKWMAENFQSRTNLGRPNWATYYFYNAERVAAEAGLKYFGTHDWFREITAHLLGRQQAGGAIRCATPAANGGELVDTAYSLLFLAKGSAPVIFNKLQHDGDWDNHIRELAALCEWLARRSERPANWQVVNLQVAPEDLSDSRILYIAGMLPLKFSDADEAKLKRFVELGGLLVFHPDRSARGMSFSAEQLLEKLWPKLEITEVDLASHRLGNIYKPLRDRRVRVQQLASPTRVFAFILTGDPATVWERREESSGRSMYELGAALHYFANDKAQLRDMPTKLTYFAEPFRGTPAATTRTVKLARIRYGDNPHRWDPEPLAFERFSRLLAAREKVGCEIQVVGAADLAASGAKVAHLTGVDDPKLSAEELKAIKAWIEAGGTLLVDQAGGPPAGREGAFDVAIRRIVVDWFGKPGFATLSPSDALVRDLDRIPYRHVMDFPRRMDPPALEVVRAGGRPAVLYSRLDLTCGLLGNPNPMAVGADDEGAYQLLRHLLGKLTPAAP